WTKDKQRLVQMKENSTKYFVKREEECRCKILQNGTLQIQHLKKEDTGSYTVMAYQRDGKLKAEENVMLFVQGGRNSLRCACPFPSFSEPVPQPILTAECRNQSVSVKCEAKE
ncbi:CD2 protein, partial [Alaudala cheleensis]|nr:CD2 protein [Alaudala cheleensis]